MDLTLELNGREYQCTEITLYEPLAGGYESIRESDVNVLDLSVPEPIGCPGCAFQSEQSLEDLDNGEQLINEGLLACQRLLKNQFGLSFRCDLSFENVDNFRTQVVSGTNYFMDISLKSSCGGKVYRCRDIKVYEPLSCLQVLEEKVMLEEI